MQSTAFLEPMSFNANTNMTFKMPAIMYGTQFSEEGITKCCLKGMDWNQFYSIWKCPRIVMEVAVSLSIRFVLFYIKLIVPKYSKSFDRHWTMLCKLTYTNLLSVFILTSNAFI